MISVNTPEQFIRVSARSSGGMSARAALSAAICGTRRLIRFTCPVAPHDRDDQTAVDLGVRYERATKRGDGMDGKSLHLYQ
jgi:hypothetical protein